ncbi:hypothetical protein OIU84_024992 [Salix udensis]|uniref:Uncharacterized protein n=1 Tax=Salix udensis TaxID=889485 RepID=A0AAD6PD46_9ROSI|nr:hypothetical protein OIU84_024992 [Salix udensis]
MFLALGDDFLSSIPRTHLNYRLENYEKHGSYLSCLKRQDSLKILSTKKEITFGTFPWKNQRL